MRKHLVLLLLCILIAGSAEAASQKSGTVTGIVRGLDVRKSPTDQWEAAKVWMPFSVGHELRTLESGRASLLFTDGTQVKLDENTHLKIEPSGVKVARGKMWLVSGKKTVRNVSTPSGVAALEGTELVVEVDDGGSRFKVIEGKVVVKNDEGSAQVPANSEATIAGVPGAAGRGASSRPRAPLVARRLDSGSWQWVKSIEDFRRTKEESESRIKAILDECEGMLKNMGDREAVLTQLNGQTARLNGELRRYTEIDVPDVFIEAHRHRIIAFQFVALGARCIQAGLRQNSHEYMRQAQGCFRNAHGENVIAEMQFAHFAKMYEAAVGE
jgi:hypothetical protein